MALTGLAVLAILPDLPTDAQKTLAATAKLTGDVTALTYLAGRPDLDGDVATTLSGHVNQTVQLRALRRTPDSPGKHATGKRQLVAQAANLHTGSDRLVDLARHADTDIALHAVCNPHTPEPARRQTLADSSNAARLVYRKSPVGAHVVRSGELATNNRWLLDHARTQHDLVLRGLLTLPDCTAEMLEWHKNKLSRWASAAHHPARLGTPPSALDTAQLTRSPSAAAHLELLQRDTTTAADAAELLNRHDHHEIDPEPHILARLVRRYGSAPFTLTKTRNVLAGTRINTAAWAEPYAGDLLNLFATWQQPLNTALLADAGRALRHLGTDAEVWSMFARLARPDRSANDSTFGLEAAAEVANTL